VLVSACVVWGFINGAVARQPLSSLYASCHVLTRRLGKFGMHR
jgi:hypothetical protein